MHVPKPLKPMLVFVVPLKPKARSKNWPLVSRLARRTLRSILAQTHAAFRVILVCTEIPEGCPQHPALTIKQVQPADPAQGGMADKWRKVRIGLVAARALAPCHIMLCDADDCVSNRLADLVARFPASHGWIFDSGWMHDENSRLIFYRRHGFDAICGTSSIVRATPEELPIDPEGGREDVHILRSGHTKIRANSIERGAPLAPLPFPGAVYSIANGENESSFSLAEWKSRRVLVSKLLNYRLLNATIRAEFGLYDLAEAA